MNCVDIPKTCIFMMFGDVSMLLFDLLQQKKKETLKMGMSSVVQLKLYPHTPGGNLMGHCKSKDMEKHHQRLGSHREHPGGFMAFFWGGDFLAFIKDVKFIQFGNKSMPCSFSD